MLRGISPHRSPFLLPSGFQSIIPNPNPPLFSSLHLPQPFLLEQMTSEDGDESMSFLAQHRPSPPVKPKGGARLLSFLLRAVVMAVALLLFFIFAGIAVFFLLLLCLIGRVLRRRRLFEAMIGPPAPESCGLSPEELRRLPCFSYCGRPEAQECAVCLEGLREGGCCRALPGCNHVFHRLCVDRWLERSPLCPICRGSVASWPPLIGR